MDGVYSFTWTYMTKKGASLRAYIGGVIDGKQIVWSIMCDQAATWASTTGHLIVRMKKNSQFWTPNTTRYTTYIHDHYTFLSGFKFSDK